MQQDKNTVICCDEDHVDNVDNNSPVVLVLRTHHFSCYDFPCFGKITSNDVLCVPLTFTLEIIFSHKFCIDLCGFVSHHLSRFSLANRTVFSVLFFSSLFPFIVGKQLNVVPLLYELLSYSSFVRCTLEFPCILWACDSVLHLLFFPSIPCGSLLFVFRN